MLHSFEFLGLLCFVNSYSLDDGTRRYGAYVEKKFNTKILRELDIQVPEDITFDGSLSDIEDVDEQLDVVGFDSKNLVGEPNLKDMVVRLKKFARWYKFANSILSFAKTMIDL